MPKKVMSAVLGAGLAVIVFTLGSASTLDVTARAPTLEFHRYADLEMCPQCGIATGCLGDCDNGEDCCNPGASQGITCEGC